MEGVKIISEPNCCGEGKEGTSHRWEGRPVEPQIIQGGRCHGREGEMNAEKLQSQTYNRKIPEDAMVDGETADEE